MEEGEMKKLQLHLREKAQLLLNLRDIEGM